MVLKVWLTSGSWMLSRNRVYVFTKDGHVVDLPVGATPVDFAYRVHTDVGNRCRGARVGGRIVPLNYTLHTGDQVEILTASNAVPSRDWLNQNLGYVKTSRCPRQDRQLVPETEPGFQY